MVDTGVSSELFSRIFGTPTQGLPLFSNNTFRRPNPTSPQVNATELESSAGRVPHTGKGEVRKLKKKKKLEKVLLEPLSSQNKEIGSGTSSFSARKKSSHGRSPEQPSAISNALPKNANSSHGSLEVVPKKKLKKHEVDSKGPAQSRAESVSTDSKVGHGRRAFKDASEQKKPIKRCKADRIALTIEPIPYGKQAIVKGLESGSFRNNDSTTHKPFEQALCQSLEFVKSSTRRKTDATSIAPTPSKIEAIVKSLEVGSIRSSDSSTHIHSEQAAGQSVEAAQANTERKTDDSPDVKLRKKRRKVEESLEARYENKYRGTDNSSTRDEDPGPAMEIEEDKMPKTKGTGKRKRIEGDAHNAERTAPRQFDTEEKLERTIFVGNLPLKVRKKDLIKEFSVYGPVESVRMRSVPLLDTKIPRKGAVIKGQINKAVDSQHGYLVFEDAASANAALAHNMKEFQGKHVRVDVAHVPRNAMQAKSSLHYDQKRSIFVGNLPFDVKDEELYQAFENKKLPDLNVEAIRVVRDPNTSISKGIAYVLFKTTEGVRPFLFTRRKITLRDRILRISRVVASQSMHKDPSARCVKARVDDVDTGKPDRKRARLSASYQGARANKEKHKDTGKSDGHQHVSGSFRGGSRGTPMRAGLKRKRMEKHQRGMSRSKKIRRA